VSYRDLSMVCAAENSGVAEGGRPRRTLSTIAFEGAYVCTYRCATRLSPSPVGLRWRPGEY
jgi:hypothetical protein